MYITIDRNNVYCFKDNSLWKKVALRCEETAFVEKQMTKFSPLTRGAGGFPPWAPLSVPLNRGMWFLESETRPQTLTFSARAKMAFPASQPPRPFLGTSPTANVCSAQMRSKVAWHQRLHTQYQRLHNIPNSLSHTVSFNWGREKKTIYEIEQKVTMDRNVDNNI